MTLNCLEEDGYDIISRVFIDDLERKPKQFYFFFFLEYQIFSIGLTAKYVFFHKFLLFYSAVLCYPRIPARNRIIWLGWSCCSQFFDCYCNKIFGFMGHGIPCTFHTQKLWFVHLKPIVHMLELIIVTEVFLMAQSCEC